MAPLLAARRQAIFLVPTRERRDVVAARRWGNERFPGIIERDRAVAKVRERDALIDARIVASCRELGLRCELVDGLRDIDDSLALLEEHFRPHLPATYNV